MCSECGKSFTVNSSLILHQRVHRGGKSLRVQWMWERIHCEAFSDFTSANTREKIPMYAANVEKVFQWRCSWFYIRVFHTREKAYICSECGKGFTMMNHLNTHHRTCTGEKPYICNECGKDFAKKGFLVKHQLTHTEEKLYVCSICGKGFNVKSHLTVLQRIHTLEKPYACNQCGKGFTLKSFHFTSANSHRRKTPCMQWM